MTIDSLEQSTYFLNSLSRGAAFSFICLCMASSLASTDMLMLRYSTFVASVTEKLATVCLSKKKKIDNIEMQAQGFFFRTQNVGRPTLLSTIQATHTTTTLSCTTGERLCHKSIHTTKTSTTPLFLINSRLNPKIRTLTTTATSSVNHSASRLSRGNVCNSNSTFVLIPSFFLLLCLSFGSASRSSSSDPPSSPLATNDTNHNNKTSFLGTSDIDEAFVSWAVGTSDNQAQHYSTHKQQKKTTPSVSLALYFCVVV